MNRGIQVNTGTIYTVAGTGENGLTGDGGQAVAACLNEPKAVALDRQGNLIIADSENHVIRKIERANGMIYTVAGRATETESAGKLAETVNAAEIDVDPLGEALPAGTHSFAQQTDLSGTVRYVINGAGPPRRFGGDGGLATHALLNFPTAVAVDAEGHLYIADQMNHRIRRVDAESGVISTLAGVGQPRFSGDGGPAAAAGLNEPAALAVSDSGVLYVADQSNNRIRAIDLRTGLIRTVAGTGSATYNGDGIPAVEAALAGPSGLAFGTDWTLYIADTFNSRIRAIDPVNGLIRTVAGDGGEYRYQGATEPPGTSVSRPCGIAVDAEGNVFLTDSDNHLVRRWDRAAGRLDRLAGIGIANYGGDGGSALEASLNYPFGIALAGGRHLFVADTFNHRIREILL